MYDCHQHGPQAGDHCPHCVVHCFMPPPTNIVEMPREVMDITQAAEYLGISTDTLYRYANEGLVPAFRLGNRWKFKRSLVDRWMETLSKGKPWKG